VLFLIFATITTTLAGGHGYEDYGGSQHEHRDGDHVIGSYELKEADGTKRIVKYRAGPGTGFEAVVEKVGEAVHPAVYGTGGGHEGIKGGYGGVGGGYGGYGIAKGVIGGGGEGGFGGVGGTSYTGPIHWSNQGHEGLGGGSGGGFGGHGGFGHGGRRRFRWARGIRGLREILM
ncbi:hypothetical protein NQ317_015170, partial [Molorchus minor]